MSQQKISAEYHLEKVNCNLDAVLYENAQSIERQVGLAFVFPAAHFI